MKRFLVAAALAVSAFAFVAPASAAPIAPATPLAGLTEASPVQLAQYRPHRPYRARRAVRRHHYVPGRAYRTAPRGWHRYRARPGNWRTRGCILVGPVWFCP